MYVLFRWDRRVFVGAAVNGEVERLVVVLRSGGLEGWLVGCMSSGCFAGWLLRELSGWHSGTTRAVFGEPIAANPPRRQPTTPSTRASSGQDQRRCACHPHPEFCRMTQQAHAQWEGPC